MAGEQPEPLGAVGAVEERRLLPELVEELPVGAGRVGIRRSGRHRCRGLGIAAGCGSR